MLQHTGRANTHEYGVSEVIGAVMLIAVVSAAIAVIAVVMLSQPAPEKIPALEAVISNTGNAIQIFHNGGDTLQKEDFTVLVNGAEVPESVLWPGSDTTWSSGETLTFSSPNAQTVQIVYTKGTTAAAVLSSANFGGVAGNSTLSLTITAGAGPGGSISPSGTVSVVYGGSQAFTIAPDTDYRIADVTVDGNSVGAVTSHSFSGVTSSHSIYATFSKNPVITASAGSGGTISPSGQVSVNSSESKTFTINASTGYHIADVLVDAVSQGAISQYTFSNVLTDHTISATFESDAPIVSYNITASSGPNGNVTPSGDTAVASGGSQTYSITPITGYHVAEVLIDSVSNGTISSYTFTNVVANHTIAATFAINQYTITAPTSSEWGFVPGWQATYYSDMTWTTVAGTRIDNEIQYANAAANTSFSLHAPTDESNWPISMVGRDTMFSVAWDGYLAVTDSDTYTFSLTSDDTSQLWIDEGLVIDHTGTDPYTPVTGTIALTPGYHHIVVKMDQLYSNAVARLQYSSSTLPLQQVTVWHPSGIVTPTGITTVDYGGSQAYNITPAAGYHVADVLVDAVSQGPLAGYTFTNVAANHTIAATFAINTYTIMASSGANGAVTPPGTTTVNYGGSQTYTIAPTTAGYHIANVLVDGVSNGTISNYTFTNVQTNHTIAATFAINQYAINATAGPNGLIDPAGEIMVDSGSSQAFNITPSTGYHVANVLVDNVSNGTITNYTFTNVAANHTIAATFLADPPVANFTATPLTGGVPLNVQFTDTSTNNPTSWIWNFGDTMNTTVSYAQHPNHTYEYPGNYSVKLWAMNEGGTGYVEKQGYIFTYYPAVANFTGTPTSGSYGLSGMSVQFTDQSTGGVSSWDWDFGDGSYSEYNTHQNPGHTYAVGLYSVNLTVENAFSSDYLIRSDYINVTPNAPTSDFETYDNDVDMTPLDHGVAPLSVFFYDLSSDAPTSWVWNFGDGNITTIIKDGSHEYADIYHTFTSAGSYNISLTAINAWGSHTAYREITVFPALTVSSMSPANGTIAGGTSVTIIGTNLVGASAATFGGTAATGVSVINATAVSAITPAHAAGAINVLVTTPNGTATGTNAYTYLIPITATSGANGAVTPAGITLYSSGATPTYTITPDTGYHVADVLVDGSSVGAVTSYTFPSLTTSHTISATFAINQYTVTSSVASGQGSISPLGVTTYNYGATPTYTITRNSTYSIGNVLVDGTSVGAVTSYTFPALAANHTISASFTKNPSVQIYYQPFTTTTGWPYDSWTRSSTTYVTLSSTIRNGSSGRSVRDAYNAYFGRTIPTTGYDEIYVRYTWATAGLSSTQYATAQDSTSGSYTEFARQTGNLASLTIVNTSRPDAGDNANYALRWQIYASQTSDYLYIDDVQVFGTAI